MRSVVFSAVVAVAFAAAAAASGSVQASSRPKKAYPAPTKTSFSWTGFYVGGNAGYGLGRPNVDTNWSNLGGFLDPFGTGYSIGAANTPKLDGFSGGFQAGYNLQLSPTVVAGLEADWQATSAKAGISNISAPFIVGGIPENVATSNYQIKLLSFGTLRARLGYLVGDNLFYATAGFAYGSEEAEGTLNDNFTLVRGPFMLPISASASSGFRASRIAPGWTVGGGVEGPIANKLTWKAEYLYLDLNALNFSSPGPAAVEPFSGRAQFNENMIRVGLNYRLN